MQTEAEMIFQTIAGWLDSPEYRNIVNSRQMKTAMFSSRLTLEQIPIIFDKTTIITPPKVVVDSEDREWTFILTTQSLYTVNEVEVISYPIEGQERGFICFGTVGRTIDNPAGSRQFTKPADHEIAELRRQITALNPPGLTHHFLNMMIGRIEGIVYHEDDEVIVEVEIVEDSENVENDNVGTAINPDDPANDNIGSIPDVQDHPPPVGEKEESPETPTETVVKIGPTPVIFENQPDTEIHHVHHHHPHPHR